MSGVAARGTRWAVCFVVAFCVWCGAVARGELPAFMQKDAPEHVRVMTYNVNWDSIFPDDDPHNHPYREYNMVEQFERVVAAINPDIVCLQEINQQPYRDPQDVADILDNVVPLGGGQTWRANSGSDDVIAARWDMSMLATDTIPTTNHGQAMALIDLPDGDYAADIYLMNAHFKCCTGSSNIARRQQHADAIIHWIGDIKTPGGHIDLPAGTPIVVLGDLNVIDDPAQYLTTLITGDIHDEGTYGPDVAPDWDESDNTDTLPLHNGVGPDLYTWRDDTSSYDPGILDHVIYSDSVVSVAKSFVLNTTTMSPEDLAAAGLQANDVVLEIQGNDYNFDHFPLVVDFVVAQPGCTSDEDCDDGVYCNGAETCDAFGSCQPGTAVDCDDGVACTIDSCNENTGACDNVPNDAACDDGLFCNGAEFCDPDLGCVGGGDPCPGQLCDEDTDACVNCLSNADCDDGLFCNGAETCDAGGECQPGADPCGPNAWCDEEGDQCLPLAEGDFDADGDVDLNDFAQFTQCFGGADNPPAAGCSPGVDADFDDDGDVDLDDFTIFGQNFTGSR